MALRVFSSPRIGNDLPEDKLMLLVRHFIAYKEKKALGPYFGRDWPLLRPNSVKDAELSHAHVHPNFLKGMQVDYLTNDLRSWSLHGRQHDKKSDTWLIYCQGVRSPDCYLLVAFFTDHAHERANRITFMATLAEEAEKWRKIY